MEFSEATRIVINRIRKQEPENTRKIIGYLLLQDHGEEEMIHLAMSPDAVIQEVIYKAKAELQQLPIKTALSPMSPSMNPAPASFPFLQPVPFLSPLSLRIPSPCWEPQVAAKQNSEFIPSVCSDSLSEFQTKNQLLNLEDQMEVVNMGDARFPSEQYYSDSALNNLGPRAARRHHNLLDFPIKTCHYFNKGYCKHGSNCRYFHGQVPENFSQMFGHNSGDAFGDDQVFSPGSLDKLELEIIELLKSRRGNPVSIASLPMLYYEKYGKLLQAEGYLTESQRHGKAGYSLTKLLARLKNSIRLIDSDRPHGQHAVILAEDAPKYMQNQNERNDPGPIVSGSRQIYLTFPAESTFTEDDVSDYFSTFGPVEDVRIPSQQKRMFGFVTFVSADTVKMILAKGNPHFVCGARVLVKPYREKSKLADRKYSDRIEHSMYFSPHSMDNDSELHSISAVPSRYENTRLFRKQLVEDQEQALEIHRRRLSELRLVRKPPVSQPYYGFPMDGLKVSEDQLGFPSEQFSYVFEVLNTSSDTGEKIKHTETNQTDQESNDGLNLPDSPFAASQIYSSMSEVM